MTDSTHNGTPAYRRIQKAILKSIEEGQLKPGDPVGSERELARLHRVSAMTARHALVGLEQDGTVERRRGSGTFVAPPRIHFNKLTSFSEQMAGRGLLGYSKILSAGVVSDQPEISARLALPSDARLWKIERLRLGAGEPFALETVYMSEQDFPELSRPRLERGSLFSLLEREQGVILVHADEEVDATPADPRAAHLLSVAPSAALLRIRQVIFSSGGKAILYVLGLYRSDRHTLHIRRFR